MAHRGHAAATDLIRNVCCNAAINADNPKLAAKLATSGTVGGVERLARADRRHAATTGEWDADPLATAQNRSSLNFQTGSESIEMDKAIQGSPASRAWSSRIART
ncbi:hypothethical protein (plasmid) [Ralstonia solanacearum PSI07]|nr:hypothethical protein [Ralstonia solanacearum PSI07]